MHPLKRRAGRAHAQPRLGATLPGTCERFPMTATRPQEPDVREGSERLVYLFGDGQADGSGEMKNLLGGKGAGLAEMSRVGIPVPPGFTITTEVCNAFYAL